jgi:acetyltransferase-like isoleucine patch superfamily enzyme
MSDIKAEELVLGSNVVIEPTAKIRGVNGRAKRVVIGDNVYIGAGVQIICDDFALGDYSKIQHAANIHGYKPCKIGHNAWIGQYTIIDSIGGTIIGDNCGIGAHSQIWSHIKYGDTLEGCRFLSEKQMHIGKDVWFVGHCIVSPIRAEDKSMAMAGSVVTKDMAFNQIYAGAPAKSISDKVGFQFVEVKIEDKLRILRTYLAEFETRYTPKHNLRIVEDVSMVNFTDDYSYFDVSTRNYKKTRSPDEVNFMKYLLPSKAKFTPFSANL